MRVLRIHLIEILIAVLFMIVMIGVKDGEENVFSTEAYSSYNNNWDCMSENNNRTTYEQLPEEVEDTQWIILSRQLTEEMRGEEYIGFYTVHQKVEAYAGGIKIYEKSVPKGAVGKTPGKCWNFIRMRENYKDKKLIVKLTNCYDDKDVKIPEFYRGAKSAITMKVVRENTIPLMLSVMLLVIGVVMAAVCTIQGKRIYLHNGIMWLGFFTIQLAIWSGLETQILQLMYGRELLFGEISYMSMKLMVCPAVQFIQSTFHLEKNKFMKVLGVAGMLDFIISFVLRNLNSIDYEQTMWITYLLAGIVGASTLIIIVRYFISNRKQLVQRRGAIWINVAGLVILGSGILLDAVNYHYRVGGDMATFTRLGWLVYIVMLGIQLLSDSAKLIQAGKKVQIIKEEAEQDALTKLKNRKCFEADMAAIQKEDYHQYAIVMFDLNNMKMMNDLYGHSMGDCYIITGSEIIRDMYGEFGDIYRIGGDEFCLITRELEEEEYKKREKVMCEWMASLRGAQIKDFMQIASGYAKYKVNTDVTLQDVQERADKSMYVRKEELKNKK